MIKWWTLHLNQLNLAQRPRQVFFFSLKSSGVESYFLFMIFSFGSCYSYLVHFTKTQKLCYSVFCKNATNYKMKYFLKILTFLKLSYKSKLWKCLIKSLSNRKKYQIYQNQSRHGNSYRNHMSKIEEPSGYLKTKHEPNKQH